jgi:hypothetical protein
VLALTRYVWLLLAVFSKLKMEREKRGNSQSGAVTLPLIQKTETMESRAPDVKVWM